MYGRNHTQQRFLRTGQNPGGCGWNRPNKPTTPASAKRYTNPGGRYGYGGGNNGNNRRIGYVVNPRRCSYTKPTNRNGNFNYGSQSNFRTPKAKPHNNNTAPFIMTPKALLVATLDSNTNIVDAATQRGNIKVVVRVRPPNNRELDPARRLVVKAVDSHLVVFDPKEDTLEFFFHGVKQKSCRDFLKKPNKDLKFVFDNVYAPEDSNHKIFNETINPTIDTILAGYNCSVFAYGATGSGKTYTMLGDTQINPGLTFLTVTELYNRLEAMKHEYESEIAISYLEVYNETVKDLLDSSSGSLNVLEDTTGVIIPKLTKHKPRDSYEILELLRRGNSVRSQHPTDYNAESSRSHAVFQVLVTLRGRYKDLNNNVRAAKLVMVDLAGSERGSATGFAGQRFKEGSSINKSLLALGNCINALADGKKHIPYRDSKLTRILKDALGGNCKTVMIANVSPSDLSYDDTYNTLSYADRAKRIKFNVKKNIMTVHARVAQYGQVVEEMAREIDYYKQSLEDLKRNCKCGLNKCHTGTGTRTGTQDIGKTGIAQHQKPVSDLTFISTGAGDAVLSPQSTKPASLASALLLAEEEAEYQLINSNNDAAAAASNETVILGSCTFDAKSLNTSPTCPSATRSRRRSVTSIPKLCDIINDESYLQLGRLLQEKVELETKQNELTAALRDLDWKLKWKSVRLDAAKTLDENGVRQGSKGIERMKKQYKGLVSSKNTQLERLTNIRSSVQSITEKLKQAEIGFCGDDAAHAASDFNNEENMLQLSRKEFIQLKEQQAELIVQNKSQSNYQQSFNAMFDEFIKTENILARSLHQLKPAYFLLKYYGHTTNEVEQKFQDIITEYCCSKIHFSIEGDKENSVVLSPFFNIQQNVNNHCNLSILSTNTSNSNSHSHTSSNLSVTSAYNVPSNEADNVISSTSRD